MEQLEKEKKVVKEFEYLCGKDLSAEDLSGVAVGTLLSCDFDSQTIWPTMDKLPVGFDSEKVMEQAKNPGLGLERLHEEGITGLGIHTAIIDQKLDLKHTEYSSQLVDYHEAVSRKLASQEISMHGPGVASLIVGKKIGVAPGTELHYEAVPCGDSSSWKSWSEALDNIIDYNNGTDDADKVRVVSCSNGYPNPGFKDSFVVWEEAVKRAKDAGIIVVDANTFFSNNFTGGGSLGDKENIDNYDLWLAVGKRIKVLDMIDSTWDRKDRIIVPCDYRTIASSWNKKTADGPDEYSYDGRGGISWSIPYLAGIFSLMLQIKGDLKMDEMIEIIHSTVSINIKGLKVINPRGIIEAVKKLK